MTRQIWDDVESAASYLAFTNAMQLSQRGIKRLRLKGFD